MMTIDDIKNDARLKEIGRSLRNDDNRCTCDPIWEVQETVRTYGMDPDYSDEFVWYDPDNCCDVDPSEIEFDEFDEPVNEQYCKVYYIDTWKVVTSFLTEAGSVDYMETKRHRHGKLRNYVSSLYNNPEMRYIRELLFKLTEEPND